MRITLVCKHDWANMAYELEQCFKSINIEAKSFTIHPHRFEYPDQAERINGNNLENYVKKSNILIFMHSQLVKIKSNINGKHIFVMHTGSSYRQNSKKLNKIFNSIVQSSFCGGDVLGFNAKNEIWIQPPINTTKILPSFKRINSDRLVIGHYPSGLNKGTDLIQSIIEELKENYDFEFRYDLNTTNWNNQIKRMSQCDIYIENMMTHQNSIPLKIFGITTLEAACLGKIPVMRFPLVKEYEKYFGSCGIQVANTLQELKKVLIKLLEMSDCNILKLKKEARYWVERCHSYQAIAYRYKRFFKHGVYYNV